MKKIIASLLFLFFPLLVSAADGSLSFAPPAGDYSVVFLGNLFGSVDGVLHGSGSQIMGAMFSVFNSAVLALGGIVIMYTLLVSTMNTAHEGQVLGQKWSSIWIPVRSTVGLSLLIPKASGYCLMQIFVMWIVLQGVGAADKIWDAALGYLNRGGVIIQAEVKNPLTSFGSARNNIARGAGTILSGQVCMVGIQKILENQRKQYLKDADNDFGPCAGNPTAEMKTFCQSAVPDFANTVNAIAVQRQSKTSLSSYSVKMPNFPSNSPYSFLNGICGTISWNGFTQSQIDQMTGVAGSSAGQLETIQMSRAIGIQQMYMTLSMVARVMVNNNPIIAPSSAPEGTPDFNDVAREQFGVPHRADGSLCTSSKENCTIWGQAPDGKGAVLFSGTELVGAVSDYNGILAPSINLLNQAMNLSNNKESRAFITQAESQGWILAGSYFFDLVRLNGSAAVDASKLDTTSGLENSNFEVSELTTSFGNQGACTGTYAKLCRWLGGKSTQMASLSSMINGSDLANTPLSLPENNQFGSGPFGFGKPNIPTVTGAQSSTAYGYIINSMAMTTPGQPGVAPDFQFANLVNMKINTSMYTLPRAHFSCGEVKIAGIKVCVGRMFGDLFYNAMFRYVYNFFMTLFQQLIEQLVMAFMLIPLQGMTFIFKQGLDILTIPGVNPIIALAKMGTTYINFSANLWIMLLVMSVSSMFTPAGIAVLGLMMMGMPLIIAWVSVMVSVGMVTAYYIPLLPYMIFTFGSIAWLMAVVEAMVAGPIVALGVTHPEGHEAFGKGEQAIMILMNVFLRPSMMIIGYIFGIALSYVGVWILNAGFEHAVSFIQTPGEGGRSILDQSKPSFGEWTGYEGPSAKQAVSNPLSGTPFGPAAGYAAEAAKNVDWKSMPDNFAGKQAALPSGSLSDGGYTQWAGIYAYFFSILIYTSTYLIIVQKSFSMITNLPDRVLRWVGGQAESIGGETAQWGEEAKGRIEKGQEQTQMAQGQIDKKLAGYGQKGIDKAKSAVGGAGGGQISAGKGVGGSDGGDATKG